MSMTTDTPRALSDEEIVDAIRAAEPETFGEEIRLAVSKARIGYVPAGTLPDGEAVAEMIQDARRVVRMIDGDQGPPSDVSFFAVDVMRKLAALPEDRPSVRHALPDGAREELRDLVAAVDDNLEDGGQVSAMMAAATSMRVVEAVRRLLDGKGRNG